MRALCNFNTLLRHYSDFFLQYRIPYSKHRTKEHQKHPGLLPYTPTFTYFSHRAHSLHSPFQITHLLRPTSNVTYLPPNSSRQNKVRLLQNAYNSVPLPQKQHIQQQQKGNSIDSGSTGSCVTLGKALELLSLVSALLLYILLHFCCLKLGFYVQWGRRKLREGSIRSGWPFMGKTFLLCFEIPILKTLIFWEPMQLNNTSA